LYRRNPEAGWRVPAFGRIEPVGQPP